ncbi:MAG: hypothetical protein JST39_07815 [Bacteroidetes bacterium]|nr:hypothetical protein [Bacteroidota bacterium]
MRRLIFILLIFLAQKSFSQLTYQNLFVDYDSAITYKNLKLIPIKWKPGGGGMMGAVPGMISFSQAMQQGLITVQERGSSSVENVHWLSLYNNSDKNIYVSSGEVMMGGRQDRMVMHDTIVPAHSGRNDLAVMCVEEERWSEKDKKFVYQQTANNHLRRTLDEARNQALVWKEINRQLEADKIKNKTFAYLARQQDKNYTALQMEYWNFFQKKFYRKFRSDSNVVGMVCMTSDKIIGSDIFVGTNLFYGQLQSLLKGYIEEAIVFGGSCSVADVQVRKYLDQFLKDEKQQEEFVKKNGKQYKAGGVVYHLTTY